MIALDILEAPTTRAMTTPEAVRAETNATDSDLIKAMIARASAAIESHTNRTFARATVRETFGIGDVEERLILTRWPVAEVQSLMIGEATILPTEYVERNGIIARRDGRPWRPHASIAVTYHAGYSLPGEDGRDLPEDLEWACLELVKSMWFAQGRDPALRSEDIDQLASQTFFAASPMAMIAPIIERYRTPAIG